MYEHGSRRSERHELSPSSPTQPSTSPPPPPPLSLHQPSEPLHLERGCSALVHTLSRTLDNWEQFQRYKTACLFSPHESSLAHLRAFTTLHAPQRTRLDALEFLDGARQTCVAHLTAVHALAFGRYMGGETSGASGASVGVGARSDSQVPPPTATTAAAATTTSVTTVAAESLTVAATPILSPETAMARRLKRYCTPACYERVAADVKLAHALRHVILETLGEPLIESVHISAIEYARVTLAQYHAEVCDASSATEASSDTVGSVGSEERSGEEDDASVERVRVVLDVATVENVKVHNLKQQRLAHLALIFQQQQHHHQKHQPTTTHFDKTRNRTVAVVSSSTRTSTCGCLSHA